jgi:patatin-like phospholipase
MATPQSEFPLTLAEVLFEELYGDPGTQAADSPGAILNQSIKRKRTEKQPYIVLNDTWFDDAEQNEWKEKSKASDEIVPIIYQAIHDLANGVTQTNAAVADRPGKDEVKADAAKPTNPNLAPRSALCLSGGGIRSATFNLGVLQGLARHELLSKFDYLSTVSGGGFIGGWLTAWIHREGLLNVEDQLGRERPVDEHGQPTPLDPEPKPVYNLRIYANYLTPKTGILSADTWTLVAVYLRNLILNWLVFLPAIMTLLMLPRIWAALVNTVASSSHPRIYLAFGLLGVAVGLISLFGILRNLPTIGNRNWQLRPILIVVVVMLSLTAVCLTLYWLGIKREPSLPTVPLSMQFWGPFWADIGAVMQGMKPGWPTFMIVGAVLPAFPLVVLSWMRGKTTKIIEPILSVLLVFAAGGVTGLLTYAAVHAELLRNLAYLCGVSYEWLFASLAVPSVLVVLMIGGTLIAGFSSRYSTPEDQEWWARCGAWTLMIILVWVVVTPLVMFGPLFLINLRGLFSGNSFGTTKAVITTVVGVVSGAITLFGGSSSKTPANGETEANDSKSKAITVLTSASAAIFAVFLIILLVWLTDWLMFGMAKSMHAAGYLAAIPPSPAGNLDSVRLLPIWFQMLATGALFGVALVAGRLINTNRFSLHYYWRNRIVRAYLGASNPDRDNQAIKSRVANHFTGFAVSDGIRMSKIAKGARGKLFHVINIALNLAGAEKLEWQDRKCESFTVSPLHCGSYWLGYRSSADYARGSLKKEEENRGTGISLGSAVAISGAAASPNMGYMMTSPVARFLMTLFNVRLGFWLGNPGVAGGGDPTTFNKPTYDRDSPAQSVRPIFSEALGMTDSESPYVYLSDGGHFENLGLYEMILRRCRLIVISDASTDPSYDFQSLAMAIRQVRVDFGVPIDMRKMSFGSKPDSDHNYCAIGTIRYSCVDKRPEKENAFYDGVLIYIKPSLIGGEPRDILNYHRDNPTFPEEAIADQWFSESQFESYRALGNHMIEEICKEIGNPGAEDLPKFELQARAHVDRNQDLNFRKFKD